MVWKRNFFRTVTYTHNTGSQVEKVSNGYALLEVLLTRHTDLCFHAKSHQQPWQQHAELRLHCITVPRQYETQNVRVTKCHNEGHSDRISQFRGLPTQPWIKTQENVTKMEPNCDDLNQHHTKSQQVTVQISYKGSTHSSKESFHVLRAVKNDFRLIASAANSIRCECGNVTIGQTHRLFRENTEHN